MPSSIGDLSAVVDEPTPEPTSVIQRVGSDEDIPAHLLNDPFVRYMMDPPTDDLVSLGAQIEAGEVYGQDHARALEDLLAGKHPLQRSRASSG